MTRSITAMPRLLTARSGTRDSEARVRLVTTSRPPAPRFFFEDLPDEARDFVTRMEVEPGTPMRLAYDRLVECATSGRLTRSIDGDEWVEEAIDTDDPSNSFEVTLNETTLYRIEVANIVGTSFSRVLTIRVTSGRA